MNAKSVVLIITFTAVAIALNSVRVPSIIYPGTLFEFSQIPVVVAFILFGPEIGVIVGVLNLTGGLTIFPLSNGLIVYPMDFVALLLMFAGISMASRFAARANEFSAGKKPIICLTALAISFRGGIMPLIDYGFLYHVVLTMVLGVNLPEALILGLLPGFVLYNVIVPLYTVPVAYVIAARVGRHLKIETRFPKQLWIKI
jgi:riboflavin transporter FmnP